MSDHVALSVDLISQCGKRADVEAGIHACSSDVVAKSDLTSGSDIHSNAEITDASRSAGSSYDRTIQTHEMNAHGSHVAEAKKADFDLEVKISSSCLSETLSGVNAESDETATLLEGDHAQLDCRHVVVPVENGLVVEKKNVDNLAFAECRICQEEDDITNLESPCACSGSLKFAHRKCVQHWCNEKGDTLCEICQKPFEGGYAMPQQDRADNIGLDLGGGYGTVGWDIANGQPRLFALTADHRFLESNYDEYAGSHAHSAACFRSVALILVALLLLRHIISMTGVGEDEDIAGFFMLSLVRAAGFLIPCYIMARAMNALQIRHQQHEASIAAAAEVTHLIQTGRIHAVVAADP